MEKFNFNDKNIQWLEYTERKILESFVKYDWDLIMPNIDEYNKEVIIDNIERLEIHGENYKNSFYFDINIVLNNGKVWYINPDNELVEKWLKENKLVKEKSI